MDLETKIQIAAGKYNTIFRHGVQQIGHAGRWMGAQHDGSRDVRLQLRLLVTTRREGLTSSPLLHYDIMETVKKTLLPMVFLSGLLSAGSQGYAMDDGCCGPLRMLQGIRLVMVRRGQNGHNGK